jgi:hypothetical protein
VLHPESVLVAAKLDQFVRIPTEILLQTLLPGKKIHSRLVPMAPFSMGTTALKF